MRKIVINEDYGGFSISLACARRMAELGNETAAAEIADYEANPGRRFFGLGYYGPSEGGYVRDDPALVQAVEELGGAVAGGEFASLKIVEIPDDVEWQIEEYDGWEWVAEKHRIWN